MDAKSRKQLKKAIILNLVFLTVVGMCLFYVRWEDRILEENPVYGYAIIVDMYLGAKAREYVKYEFIVNGVVYVGHQGYMYHKEMINIGDSCEVVYAASNPKINKLLKDENKLIKVKPKKSEIPLLRLKEENQLR